jgi:hypothetical protein
MENYLDDLIEASRGRCTITQASLVNFLPLALALDAAEVLDHFQHGRAGEHRVVDDAWGD